MSLYAFGIVSKRPFYFFGAPRFRARRLFCFFIQIQRFPCKNLVFDNDFYSFFVEMLCFCIVFPFLLLTFDVALRYPSAIQEFCRISSYRCSNRSEINLKFIVSRTSFPSRFPTYELLAPGFSSKNWRKFRKSPCRAWNALDLYIQNYNGVSGK